MADSVAFPPKPKELVDDGLGGAKFDLDSSNAKKDNATISSGNEDLKVISKDSANVMNIPLIRLEFRS